VVCPHQQYGLSLLTNQPCPINTSVVIASICICIALLVLTPEKQSAKWVFTEFTDGSGWGSKGFSFLLGFVGSPLQVTIVV